MFKTIQRSILAVALLPLPIAAVSAHGQQVICAQGAPCNPAQTLQDQSSSSLVSHADGSQSQVSRSNPSSASNASGVQINPTLDTKGSVNQTPTQTQNQTGTQAANANGNQSENKNNASIGQTSTGVSTVGPVTSGSTSSANNGGNKNDNHSSSESSSGSKSEAYGGAGGKGGAGGSATGGTGGTSRVGNVGGGTAAAQGGTSSAGASNTISTTLDASDRSVTNNNSQFDARTLVLPPMVQPVTPGFTNSGGIVVFVSPCGPQLEKRKEAIKTFRGGFFHDKMIQVGWSEDVVPLDILYKKEPLSDGRNGYIQVGSQAVIMETKIGTSTNKGAGAGGNGGRDFSGGQLGFSSASASEQVVRSITILPCQVAVIVRQVPEPVVAPPVVIPPEPKHDTTPTPTPAASVVVKPVRRRPKATGPYCGK